MSVTVSFSSLHGIVTYLPTMDSCRCRLRDICIGKLLPFEILKPEIMGSFEPLDYMAVVITWHCNYMTRSGVPWALRDLSFRKLTTQTLNDFGSFFWSLLPRTILPRPATLYEVSICPSINNTGINSSKANPFIVHISPLNS